MSEVTLTTTPKPLSGLKVVELGTLIAGPFAARILAEFGAEPVNSTDIANALGLSLSQAAPIRDELIKKGMAYSPERGLIGFTVPKFDEFMRRAMPTKPKR